jgi:hypothetical protein
VAQRHITKSAKDDETPLEALERIAKRSVQEARRMVEDAQRHVTASLTLIQKQQRPKGIRARS